MQKELGRYLLPVSRKKYKTDHHLKKNPPKSLRTLNHIFEERFILEFSRISIRVISLLHSTFVLFQGTPYNTGRITFGFRFLYRFSDQKRNTLIYDPLYISTIFLPERFHYRVPIL